MLINTLLLLQDQTIIQGLLNGTLIRYGSVIRYAAGTENAGQIVKHLAETSSFTNKLMMIPTNPLLGTASVVTDIIGHIVNNDKLTDIQKILTGVQQTLSQVMGLTQIAAGASVLNLGISVAGFAYMGYKLGQVQKSLGELHKTVEVGFDQVNTHLNQISGQLAYLYLLVQDNRQKQESLAKAISHLHQAMLIQEIASLKAELEDHSRFPYESPREALRTASRVRLFLGSEAVKVTPELNAELMLNSDISIQGWAVAIATETHLLLEIGKYQEAKQLLSEEVPKFKQVAERWADYCIRDDNQYIATAYRFDASPFKNDITPERVNRITQISKCDRTLTPDQIRRKRNAIEIEFEMSYSQEKYHQAWMYQQIAIAEYLDTLSELLARLDTLQDFTALCEKQGVKSSKELLPNENTESELYLLPVSDK